MGAIVKKNLMAAIAAVAALGADAVQAGGQMRIPAVQPGRVPSMKWRARRVPDWRWCPQCENYRSNNGKHRCRAPYIPAPRHGWRYERGKLVPR